MATAVILPRYGNSVEHCIVASWKKQVGESVQKGEVLCDVETDKAIFAVESPAEGVLLAHFFAAGDVVPVQTTIAAVGQPGEAVDNLGASHGGADSAKTVAPPVPEKAAASTPIPTLNGGEGVFISPRARQLAIENGLVVAGIIGTGPEGRIIERDIQAALAQRPRLTALAKSLVTDATMPLPEVGSGLGGRITAQDIQNLQETNPEVGTGHAAPLPDTIVADDDYTAVPIKGVRKITAERMKNSLHTSAQLTLNTSADARALLAYRQKLKNSPETLGLRDITLNDMLLYAVARLLPQFPDLNALLKEDTIYYYRRVHVGFAVDTPRGLLVPVLQDTNKLSLKALSQTARDLATAAQHGNLPPDAMSGGTFTVSNLGSLGIESFTPIINPPQVAILGVGNTQLKPIETNGDVQFIPHVHLSLTIDHQVVDGAPGARFLQALTQALANIELWLAL
jgi:pyruvate dehydrogenase E2 component (dihydrolipoamide acetyltransferase)